SELAEKAPRPNPLPASAGREIATALTQIRRALVIPNPLKVMVAAGRASGGFERFDRRRDCVRAEAPAALALRAGVETDARVDLGGIERALPFLDRCGFAGGDQFVQFARRSQNGGASIGVEGRIERGGGN